jgi:hypothetical protein
LDFLPLIVHFSIIKGYISELWRFYLDSGLTYLVAIENNPTERAYALAWYSSSNNLLYLYGGENSTGM